MTLKVFIFFSIFYILCLITADIIFSYYIEVFFDVENDDKRRYCFSCILETVVYIILSYFVWAVIALMTGAMAGIKFSDLKFIGIFLSSSYGLGLLSINTIIVFLITAFIGHGRGYFIYYRLEAAIEKAESIQKCQSDIKVELQRINAEIKETKDDGLKDTLLVSQKKFRDELNTYKIMERSNNDLITYLKIILNNRGLK